MAAIFAGTGFGLGRGSASVLGGAGLLGSSPLGRGGEGVFVNAATGNLLINKQDEFLVGSGPDVGISRTYNSLTTLADDNNDKWRQSSDRRVYGLSGTYGAVGSSVKRVSGDGTEIIYTWNASWRNGTGAYVATDGGGAYDTIVKSGSTWVWTGGDSNFQETYYDQTALNGLAGKIISVDDRGGKKLAFSYVSGTSRLDKITTSNGEWIRYDYDASGNISKIVTGYTDLQTSTAKTLTRTRYGYDGSNRLTTVTVDLSPEDNLISDGKSYVTTYSYNASGRVSNIAQSDGSSLAITYDGTGKVSTLAETAASGAVRTTSVTYGAGYTNITDPTGQITRMDYDAAGNLTKITAPAAFAGASQQVVQFAYNAKGDLISTTDALGKITSFSNFTVDGQAQTITDRLGNVTTRTFGSVARSGSGTVAYSAASPYATIDDSSYITNVLLSETTSSIDDTGVATSRTARLVYNLNGDVVYKISAEGRVTEYSYASRLLVAETTYTDVTYTAAGTPSETTLVTWKNGIANKSAIVQKQYSLDSRGALASTTTFGSYSTAGAGNSADGISQSYYVYDQAGQLLKTYDNQYSTGTNFNATTYLYDGMGRVTAATDINGGVTTFSFSDAATTTTVTLASGYVVTKTYNKAGDLISQIDSGANTQGGATQYAYDKLGRVRVRTDAYNGTKTYSIYDNAGRLTGEADNAGYLTEYRYDADNRLVGSIRYQNAISAANLASLANPDLAANINSIRPATPSAQDISSWTVYDNEGRVLQTIGGDGSTNILAYDASSRLQSTTAYFNKLSAAVMTAIFGSGPTGTVVPTLDLARDTVARNFFDKDGLPIGRLDGEGYVTKNVYDKGGRLVSSTQFATQVPSAHRASSWQQMVLDVGTSASDRTSRLVYDSRNLLRFEINAAGQVVEHTYWNSSDKVAATVQYDAALGTQSSYSYLAIKTALAGLGSAAGKRTSNLVYDQAERLTFMVGPTGTVTAYSYDTSGRINKTVQYAAAYTGGLTDQTGMSSWAATQAANGANRVSRFWYTERGEAAYTLDAEYNLTRALYNADSRLISQTVWSNPVDPGGGGGPTVTDSTTLAQIAALATGTLITSYSDYDSLGRLARTTDGVGAQTAYAYFGTTSLVTAKIEADNGTATEKATNTVAYDGAGRAIQTTAATGAAIDGGVGAVTSVSYDGKGEVLTSTDARSKITTFTYDLNGKVKTVTDAASGITTFEYNAFGQAWKVTDARGIARYNWYDKLGQVTTSRDTGGYITKTAYTVFGEVVSVTRYASADTATPAMWTEPGGTGTAAITSFTYDKMSRVLTSTDAEGNAGHAAAAGESRIEAYAYDTLGNRITSANRLTAATTYTYDRLGRVIRQSVDAATSNHDAAGSLIAGAQLVTTFAYDTRGNVVTKAEGYSASAGGAVTALRTTTYKYDNANRVSEVWHDAVSTIADDMVTVTANVTPKEFYTYDFRGRLTKFVDAGGAQTYNYYDDLDRKIAEVRQLSGTQWVYTANTYDASGNLASVKVYDSNSAQPAAAGGAAPPVPAGIYRQTDFGYDDLGRMITSAVISNSGNLITSGTWNGTAWVSDTSSITTTYSYNANGNVIKVTDPNLGVTWSWYDQLGRKTAQLDAEGYLTGWIYNSESNVTTETRYATRFTGAPTTSAPPSPGTNAADRVTDFEYDLIGNRTKETRRNVIAWNVDAATGALTASASADSIVQYSYNALGQVVSKTVAGAQIATYTYDKTARLTSEARAAFTDANGTTVTPATSYLYDSIGDLVSTTQNGTAAGTYTALDRVTSYRYGEGGRRISMTDAEGYVHTYNYDVMGRVRKDAYNRMLNTDTASWSGSVTTIAEAQTKTYDLAGRVLAQAIYSTLGGSFQRVGYTSYLYNNYDQVVSQGTGSNSALGMNAGSELYQASNQYDGAGRLVGTNSGDGVWKFFGYDKLGNQTTAVSSAGVTFTSATGFASALSQAGSSQVNATYTVYDRRNMASQVAEEGRDLSASVTGQMLTTSRAYNAFGEVASETNALGNTITYNYSTMGRMVRSESPAISITLENGLDIWIKPAEDYYYDLGGRQIAIRDANGTYGSAANTQGTAYAKAADTGNLTTLALLAGTGYDKSQALVATEFHADGGKKQMLFDVMGDARVLRDELYSASTPNLHAEEMSYNRLGQLAQLKHNRASDVADDTTRLVDNYLYDQFGQKIQHWNSQLGGADIEKTGYDALGRVTAQTDLSGYLTATTYAWDGTLNTSIGGSNVNLGGFVETVTYANNRTAITRTDLYNHELFKQDLGGHQFTATYDAAGRMASRGGNTYSWYNTGLIASSAFVTGNTSSPSWDRKITSYGYNATGNRVTENTTNDGSQQTWVSTAYSSYPTTSTYNYSLVSESATYDALGRLTSMTAAATNGANGYATPAATITEKYDAAGNIRNTASVHAVLNAAGAAAGTVTESFWFRYDAMNRLVTDKGSLSGAAGAAGTTIVRGNTYAGSAVAQGQDYVYDAAGQRVAALRTEYSPGGSTYYSNYLPGTYQETRENYDYDGAGRVADIRTTSGSAVLESYDALGNPIPPASLPAASASGGVTRSLFGYDLMGRQISQTDYDAAGTVVIFSRSAVYDANGFLSSDSSTTKKYEANYTTNL